MESKTDKNKCIVCNKSTLLKRYGSLYCSEKCKQKHYRQKDKEEFKQILSTNPCYQIISDYKDLINSNVKITDLQARILAFMQYHGVENYPDYYEELNKTLKLFDDLIKVGKEAKELFIQGFLGDKAEVEKFCNIHGIALESDREEDEGEELHF